MILFIVILAVGAHIVMSEKEGDFSSELAPNLYYDLTEVLKRLQMTEQIVHQLYGHVQTLETRNKNLQERIQTLEEHEQNQNEIIQTLQTRDQDQQRQIRQLQTHQEAQRTRTNLLEKMIRQTARTNSADTADKDNEEEKVSITKGVKQLSTTKRNRIRRVNNEITVAFTATIADHHIEHAGNHQVIVFDNIITNVGNAYNGHFGSFVAPVNGIYVFSVTLFSDVHTSYHGHFVKNGQILTWMYLSGAESNGYQTSSQTVVLQLQKGDDVCIQHGDVDRNIFGYNHTLFSGFLLQEDFSAPVVVG